MGGTKDELAGYFKLLASHGYVVAAPRYSLAPEHRYPTPPRQAMAALEYILTNADELLVDGEQIALAGDSAGAHIAAQVAALVTTPGYSDTVGIPAAIKPAQLRALVLACGPYDLGLADQASTPAGQRFIQIVLWAYSGKRDFLTDRAFAAWSITDQITPAFPPALVTVGNADPLKRHSGVLVAKLRDHGIETETIFYTDDHQPPLGHEYQFDLDADPGQRFLERVIAFLGTKLATAPQGSVRARQQLP